MNLKRLVQSLKNQISAKHKWQLRTENHWKFEAFDKNGRLLWVEEIDNDIVNVGLNDLLNQYFKGSGYTATWYVGVTDGTPTIAAGDTMASHVGWVEVTAYTEANRPTLTLGTVASQSVDNVASKAVFSINAAATTLGGGFIVFNNTKGGTTGPLYGVAAFTGGDRVLGSGDTLNVTVTLTAASA